MWKKSHVDVLRYSSSAHTNEKRKEDEEKHESQRCKNSHAREVNEDEAYISQKII